MKKAVPVRMPDWDGGDFPTSKQLELYLLYWERRRDALAPDPGVGVFQKSFWLDPEDLDVNAYEAECFRASRPDRALFIRRLIATYHKSRTSKQVKLPHRPVPQSASGNIRRPNHNRASNPRMCIGTNRSSRKRSQSCPGE